MKKRKEKAGGDFVTITFQQLIDSFLSGETEGVSGSQSNPGTLKISGNQLIHYSTPIAERYNDKIIFNVSRYSLQTGQLQKELKASIPETSALM
ncbi:MAG TPA: hypothetical protein DD391_05150 [Clostridiales bacterium]|nr:hypothetical protein [Clostridiales bacterium]HBL81975.1 hypothetical protein [Clostridiales bacterium]